MNSISSTMTSSLLRFWPSLRVLSAIVDGDAEREHLGAGRGGAKLGIAGEVSGDVDSVDAHWLLSFRFRRGADPPAFVAMYVPRCSDA